ncbi:MAG: coenzyme F420 hydrogenase/dehydrogenase beta subunit N-terminal domain-containing protein, partial [Methanobacterium sp.]|nr:coenzyme F420 hydrogenase/dehydrogenase beta subunit N-terminal domain-containing protein [Methanobacterium sp.]
MNNTVSKDINSNISSVVSEGLCTGCGTCTALCAKEIIKMELNSQKGTFLPKINEKYCVNCGICYKVCPGLEVDFEKLNMEIFGKKPKDSFIGNYTDCYTGCSTDKKIRFDASSGGIITQFLIFALDKKIIDGAMVTRMNKNYPLKPEPFIARTRQEIVEASQSKYCPVPVNLALKEILNAPD